MIKRSFNNLAIFSLIAGVSQFTMAHAGVSGAIFTTIADGTIVNANTQYASKCDVYLDGGPGANAPAKAAGLPSGDYYFQVTDPNGQTLLSTDPVSNRRFTVYGGVITAYTGMGGPAHPTGLDQVDPSLGAITISLANTTCPTDYLDTPNNGGVYKVWVTPVASFVGEPKLVDNSCGSGCYHGFVPSASKTDNFKVAPTIPTFTLTVTVQTVSGGVVSPSLGSQIILTFPGGSTNSAYTNNTDGTVTIGGLVAGTYTVTDTTSNTVYTFTWAAGQPAPSVTFQDQVPALPF